MRLPPRIPTFEQAYDDLKTTLGRLFSAFEDATERARTEANLKGYDGSFFSHQIRFEAKMALRASGIEAEEDWGVEDTANTGICLTLPDYFVRILRSQDGEIPVPDSERRRRFLEQKSEQMEFSFTAEVENTDPEVVEQEPTHIVLLSEVDQERFFTGFWFTCPNGVGKYFFKEWLPRPEVELRIPRQPPPPPDDLGGITRKEDQSLPRTGNGIGE